MQSRTNQAAAVLLGHLYTQAAVKKALEERGQGFTVSKRDVEEQLYKLSPNSKDSERGVP